MPDLFHEIALGAPHRPVAGIDEVGRGPLAGPVTAAAVILPRDLDPALAAGLADSKTLTRARREWLEPRIRAVAIVGVGWATVEEVDSVNILQATFLAMIRAVESLALAPEAVLVDGNRLPPLPMPAHAIVGGDAKVAAIAAASIVAKVHRDRLCGELHRRYPQYEFASHKGYPTAQHLRLLQLHGPCDEHRRSFAPVRSLLP